MAQQNKYEILIRKARTSADATLKYAYDLTLLYIEAKAELDNQKDELRFFNYLYTKNHAPFNYHYIGNEILFTSVSTLEDRRKKFVAIFRYFLNLSQDSYGEAVVSKSE